MSSSYRVAYSPKATKDLKEIYYYIASVLMVPDTAEGQINRIRESIRSLGTMPLRNPAVDWEPWKSMGMRKIFIDNFAAFYIVNKNNLTVTVVRIVYGGRDIEKLAIPENED